MAVVIVVTLFGQAKRKSWKKCAAGSRRRFEMEVSCNGWFCCCKSSLHLLHDCNCHCNHHLHHPVLLVAASFQVSHLSVNDHLPAPVHAAALVLLLWIWQRLEVGWQNFLQCCCRESHPETSLACTFRIRSTIVVESFRIHKGKSSWSEVRVVVWT